MKGLGNYSFPSTVERKPGVLLMFRGKQAVVRFHDGQTYGMPAKGFHEVGIEANQRFMLVVVRRGKKVMEVRAEALPQARPARPRQATPRVYRRDGRKVVTRKTR